MPIIERIIKTEDQEMAEKIVDFPFKSGSYDSAYGQISVRICPVTAQAGHVNMRKVIISGEFIGARRITFKLHPSPYHPSTRQLSTNETLVIKSRNIKQRKGV